MKYLVHVMLSAMFSVAMSCSGAITNGSEHSETNCPDGTKRVQVNCTSVTSLKERVAAANVGIPSLGLGFGGSYEERALGQITNSTQQLAVSLESKCQQYNACAISAAEWTASETEIRNQLNQHVNLTEQLKQKAADIQIGDALYSNAVPAQASQRLSFSYALEVLGNGGNFVAHTSGATLPSGSEFRVQIQTNQQAYAYILLLSSQGEATSLFPMQGISQVNPLPPNVAVTIPDAAAGTFELDNVMGTEHLQIILSLQPLNDIESRLQTMQSGKNSGQDNSLLSTIGNMLCDGQDAARTRGIKLKPSSVDCGGIRTRGIKLKPAPSAAAPSAATIPQQLVSRPFDTILIEQHTIEHI